MRLTASERSLLLSGDPVTKLLDSDPSKEVAVFGAVWIQASPSTYVQQVQDIRALRKRRCISRHQADQHPADA